MMNTLRKTTICLAPLLAFLLFHSFIIAAEENRSDQACLFNIIKNRRTVRRFKSTPVPKEHILKILDAARFAPTAGNQQPWKFLVIQDRAKLELLKKDALLWYLDEYKKTRKPTKEELSKSRGALKKILEDVLSAPVYVAVLVDSKAKYSNYILYDGTLAAGYLMIAARALDYGTGFFTSFFPEEKMKRFFNIPEQYKLICFTPVGVPDKWPETPPKKKLEEIVIFESF
jgi:nitroreductase